MTVREWLKHAELRLKAFEATSPSMEAQLLARHILRVDRTWLFAHPEAEFNELAGEHLLQRRESGEPLAYILGHKEFFGREFSVDPAVLIPRHETETLIETALELYPDDGNPIDPKRLNVLDLGTGSGILAITLKLERPEWIVTAVDVSPEALTTASANARFHHAHVRFVHSDGFETVLGETFDLILSNPPYIGRTEELPVEVRSFEPDLALFAENNGMAFYEMLAHEAHKYLADQGMLLMEIGYRQYEAVRAVFDNFGWVFALERRDLSGTLRVLGFRHEFDCLTSEDE